MQSQICTHWSYRTCQKKMEVRSKCCKLKIDRVLTDRAMAKLPRKLNDLLLLWNSCYTRLIRLDLQWSTSHYRLTRTSKIIWKNDWLKTDVALNRTLLGFKGFCRQKCSSSSTNFVKNFAQNTEFCRFLPAKMFFSIA